MRFVCSAKPISRSPRSRPRPGFPTKVISTGDSNRLLAVLPVSSARDSPTATHSINLLNRMLTFISRAVFSLNPDASANSRRSPLVLRTAEARANRGASLGRGMLLCALAGTLTGLRCEATGSRPVAFPSATWEARTPAQMGLDAHQLDSLAGELGGRGCVVKDGYIVKAWGDQSQVADILSS